MTIFFYVQYMQVRVCFGQKLFTVHKFSGFVFRVFIIQRKEKKGK